MKGNSVNCFTHHCSAIHKLSICYTICISELIRVVIIPIILPARSIASKGKSDVKESTDSSTTLEDDEKGKHFTHQILGRIELFTFDIQNNVLHVLYSFII